MNREAIAIIATLDTKGPEAAFVKDCIEAAGCRAIVLDTSILDYPGITSLDPDVSADHIARQGGVDRKELVAHSADKDTRNRGVKAMAAGSARVLKKLYDQGRIAGVIGLGGAQGTEICTCAMRNLPLGVPKMMVSTVASGQATFGLYTGTRDLTIMHSVVDILGLNSLTRRILSNAAGAVTGMVKTGWVKEESGALKVGITIYGQTTPAALFIKPRLEAMGYEIFTFHSNGTGGKAMEELALEGMLDGIFDLSTHEVTDEIFHGIHAGDSNRLLSGGSKAVPRLVVPGGVDIITLGELDRVPEAFRTQPLVRHNPHITLVRLTEEQMIRVAEVMAERLNQSIADVIVVIPTGGLSFYNRDGLHFWNLDADRMFAKTLQAKLKSTIKIHRIDRHVNDPEFTEAIIPIFNHLMQRRRQ